MPNAVFQALCELRPPFAPMENDLHALVAKQLTAAGFAPRHEVTIGPACRIDFLVDGVGIEIKKGKPALSTLTAQLSRYAACEAVDELIVITQRFVRLPSALHGKPLRLLSLSHLWGVALP